MEGKNGFFKKIFKAIKKHKLLTASVVFYVIIPVLALYAVLTDNRYRTAGTYYSYENGVLTGKLVLKRDNSLLIESLSEVSKKDPEFLVNSNSLKWTYGASDWYLSFDNKKYEHLSREYVVLHDESRRYSSLFFEKGKLYTSYLLTEDRGGVQKCYVKQ